MAIGDWVKDPDAASQISYASSDLREGCGRLTYTIKTWVHFRPAGVYHDQIPDVDKKGQPFLHLYSYDLKKWETTEQTEFKNKFAKRIEEAWGNGRFWLLHVTANQEVRDLWCDVKIDFNTTRGEANMVVDALNEPTPKRGAPEFRAWCGPFRRRNEADTTEKNPIDMTIELQSIRAGEEEYNTTVHGKPGPKVKQETLLHEFGHYLRLPHTCEAMAKHLRLPPGSADISYCSNQSLAQQSDLMAMGSDFVDRHGAEFATRVMDLHRATDYPATEQRVQVHSLVQNKNRSSRPWMSRTGPQFEWARKKKVKP